MGNNQRSGQLTILDKVINYIENLNKFLVQDIDEFYYQLIENAIEYGMTIKQFWEEDIEIFYCYQYAYLRKLHNTCHTQGLYNYMALGVALGNVLKKKGTKDLDYPKENLLEVNLKEIENQNKKVYTKKVNKENLEEQYRLRLASCY